MFPSGIPFVKIWVVNLGWLGDVIGHRVKIANAMDSRMRRAVYDTEE